MPSNEGGGFAFAIRNRRERTVSDDGLIQLQSKISQLARIAAVSEMAATIAHQLNQPLAAVTNYVKAAQRLLGEMPASDEARTTLDKAAEQALRAGQVVRQAREFVRIDENEKQIENASDLLAEATSCALLWPHDQRIAVSFHFDCLAHEVRVNRLLIQQVVVSLIRNAMREMVETPRRELTISTHCDDGHVLNVQIADSGPGIADEARRQVFEPFVTGRSDRIGMGLSVSRSIIGAHGGNIFVLPNPDGGSVFTFTLPLHRHLPLRAAAA
jgi:two-component system sensor kinase FixL